MNSKDIMLKIVGQQISRNDEIDDDSIEFMTEGRMYKKGDDTYIVYDETEFSGTEGVKTSLRIDGDGGIRMKRFGSDVMTDTIMEFREGKRYSSMYATPFGPIEMEVLTNRIVNDLEPASCTGKLFIDYDISLKGLMESRSLLNIEVTERSALQ